MVLKVDQFIKLKFLIPSSCTKICLRQFLDFIRESVSENSIILVVKPTAVDSNNLTATIPRGALMTSASVLNQTWVT